MEITCPFCGRTGNEVAFGLSLADECFCECGGEFILEYEDDEESEAP